MNRFQDKKGKRVCDLRSLSLFFFVPRKEPKMKLSLVFLLFLATILVASGEDVCAKATAENPITHFFILMMENRSFDHFLVCFFFFFFFLLFSLLLLFSKKKKKDILVLFETHPYFSPFLKGWLKSDNKDIIGLTGQEFNYMDPDDKGSKKIFVDDLAENVDPDFDHV